MERLDRHCPPLKKKTYKLRPVPLYSHQKTGRVLSLKMSHGCTKNCTRCVRNNLLHEGHGVTSLNRAYTMRPARTMPCLVSDRSTKLCSCSCSWAASKKKENLFCFILLVLLLVHFLNRFVVQCLVESATSSTKSAKPHVVHKTMLSDWNRKWQEGAMSGGREVVLGKWYELTRKNDYKTMGLVSRN